jgi:hypothetical protein
MSETGIETEVCEDICRRKEGGFRKYGVTVADNPLPLRDWLQHAYEECLDMAIYLKRAMRELPTAQNRSEDGFPLHRHERCVHCGWRRELHRAMNDQCPSTDPSSDWLETRFSPAPSNGKKK